MQPVDHTARGLSRLAQQFKGKPRIEGVLRVLLSEVDALEAAIQQVNSIWNIDDSEGAQLDAIGRIVGQERGSLDDPALRRWLAARVQANRSRGRAQDIQRVFAALAPDSDPAIEQEGNATFALVLHEAILDDIADVVALVKRVKAKGVRVLIEYRTVAESESFTFDAGPGFDTGTLAVTALAES